jgi:hypothetical protein
MDPNQFLQGMNAISNAKTRAEQARTTEELAEINRREAEEQAKPQCPVCGGRIEKGFAKCKHCNEELIWADNIVGRKVDGAEGLQQIIEKRENLAREKERQRQLLAQQEEEREQRQKEEDAKITPSDVIYFLMFWGAVIYVCLVIYKSWGKMGRPLPELLWPF